MANWTCLHGPDDGWKNKGRASYVRMAFSVEWSHVLLSYRDTAPTDSPVSTLPRENTGFKICNKQVSCEWVSILMSSWCHVILALLAVYEAVTPSHYSYAPFPLLTPILPTPHMHTLCTFPTLHMHPSHTSYVPFPLLHKTLFTVHPQLSIQAFNPLTRNFVANAGFFK